MRDFMKGSGMGIFVVFVLLLSSSLSWGDTRLMADQAAATGNLTLTIWDGAYQTCPSSSPSCAFTDTTTNSAPNLISCEVPNISWDYTLGGWIVIGSDASGNMWSGKVTCGSYGPAVGPCYYTTVSGTIPSSGSCANAPASPACLTSSTPPTCTYSGWSACSAGFQTRTASPAGCIGSLPLLQSCTPPANGQCGSDSGQAFSSLTAATSGLCSAGTVTSFSGTGPWTWYCAGTNGGSTSSQCSATYTSNAVNGQCGSASGGTYSSLTATSPGLCGAGTVTSFSGTGPWTWYCAGANGGSTSSQCSANLSSSTGGGAVLIHSSSTNYGSLGMSTTNPQLIAANGENHYYLVLQSVPASFVEVYRATEDWETSQNIYISNVSQPSCSGASTSGSNQKGTSAPPWYNIVSSSPQIVYVSPAPVGGSLTYYVTVCNTTGAQGKFGLYYIAR
jgi:hypothetical protein